MRYGITIDPLSGFCYGVVRAVQLAEEALQAKEPLYSLGAIVHNNMEASRLRAKGLQTVTTADFSRLEGHRVLIRAHGEPPQTYALAREYRVRLIDGTCPVVLKLQQSIRDAYERLHPQGGQVVLLGRAGHAEVNGLAGQINGDLHIVQGPEQVLNLDFDRKTALFAQTTQDPTTFDAVSQALRQGYARHGFDPEAMLEIHKSICGQVSRRGPAIKAFAATQDIVLFISGKESSNGQVLFKDCLQANARSHKIQSETDIVRSWFKAGDRIGICGATSTPRWLLEQVAAYLENAL